MKMLMYLVMVMAMVCMVSSLAQAATYVSENFNDGSLDAALENPGGSYVYTNNKAELLGPVPGGTYEAIRTVDSDWRTSDFVFEVSINFTSSATVNDGGNEDGYIGLGVGGDYSPLTSYAIHLEPLNSRFSERVRGASGAPAIIGAGYGTLDMSTGVTRVRGTRVGENLLWEFDADYNGTFSADASRLLSTFTSTTGFLDNTNSHLLVQTGRYWYSPSRTSFDDLAITAPIPEPATLALLGLGGLMALRRKR